MGSELMAPSLWIQVQNRLILIASVVLVLNVVRIAAAEATTCAWGGTYVSTADMVSASVVNALREAARLPAQNAGIDCKDAPQVVTACSSHICLKSTVPSPGVVNTVTFRLVQVGNQFRYDAVLINRQSQQIGIIAQGAAGSLSALSATSAAIGPSIKHSLIAQGVPATRSESGTQDDSPENNVDPVGVGLFLNGYSNGYAIEFGRVRFSPKYRMQMSSFKAKLAFNFSEVEEPFAGDSREIFSEKQMRVMAGIIGLGQYFKFDNFELGYLAYPLGIQVHGVGQTVNIDAVCSQDCESTKTKLSALPVEAYIRYNLGPVFLSLDASYPLIPIIDEDEILSDDLKLNAPPQVKRIEPNLFFLTIMFGFST